MMLRNIYLSDSGQANQAFASFGSKIEANQAVNVIVTVNVNATVNATVNVFN